MPALAVRPARLAIVCGVAFGGTTLMLDMLRAHPRVFGPWELGLLLASGLRRESIRRWYRKYPEQSGILAGEHGIDADGLADLAELAGGDWMDFYARLLARMTAGGEHAGRDVLVDKRHDYARSLSSHVYRRLPDVPAVVVVRDPRSVYCSWTRRSTCRATVGQFVDHYAAMMRGAAAALADGRPVLMVRFERLVADPASVMRPAAEFLGLDYAEAMASPANSYSQHERTKFISADHNRWPRPADLDRRVLTEWRHRLMPGEAKAVVAELPGGLEWTLHDSGKDLPCRPAPEPGPGWT